MLAVPGPHTPTDWKVRLCVAKVKYIEADRRSSLRNSASPGAPGALRWSETSCCGSG